MSVSASGGVEAQEVKCVVVGDGTVGKTCMLISYTENKFPDDYVPTIFDNYETRVMVDSQEVIFSLWDTAGQESYSRIRVLSYPRTDVFLLCFSIINRHSFKNIMDLWVPELRHHAPTVPIILVGTKSDLRPNSFSNSDLALDDQNLIQTSSSTSIGDSITIEEGHELAAKMRAVCYMECSSKTNEGLKSVFDQALLRCLFLHHKHNSQTNTSVVPPVHSSYSSSSNTTTSSNLTSKNNSNNRKNNNKPNNKKGRSCVLM